MNAIENLTDFLKIGFNDAEDNQHPVEELRPHRFSTPILVKNNFILQPSKRVSTKSALTINFINNVSKMMLDLYWIQKN